MMQMTYTWVKQKRFEYKNISFPAAFWWIFPHSKKTVGKLSTSCIIYYKKFNNFVRM